MEIKVNLVIDITDKLASAISTVAAAIAGDDMAPAPAAAPAPAPAPADIPEPQAEEPKKKGRKAKEDAAPEEPKKEAEQTAPAMTLQDVQTTCQEAIDADENNREKIAELRNKFGVDALRKLDPKDYPAFVAKVKALML